MGVDTAPVPSASSASSTSLAPPSSGSHGGAGSGGDYTVVPPTVTSNPILQAALRSRRGVEDLFLWITKSATAHCQHAERQRSAATLEADCAAAYIRRGDYKAARPLLRSQAARYFEDQWFELYVHVQTLIAYCDYRIRDWQHYM